MFPAFAFWLDGTPVPYIEADSLPPLSLRLVSPVLSLLFSLCGLVSHFLSSCFFSVCIPCLLLSSSGRVLPVFSASPPLSTCCFSSAVVVMLPSSSVSGAVRCAVIVFSRVPFSAIAVIPAMMSLPMTSPTALSTALRALCLRSVSATVCCIWVSLLIYMTTSRHAAAAMPAVAYHIGMSLLPRFLLPAMPCSIPFHISSGTGLS